MTETGKTDRSWQLPIVRPGQQVMLLAMWAVLMGLAYPWPNLWLLAFVALVPLTLLGARGKPLGRVAAMTYGAGVVWWLAMVYWIMPVSGPGYVVLGLYMGVYPLAFILLMRLIYSRWDLPFTLTVPVVWVGLEYVRGLVMTGFPWFLLGQSQPTMMIQIADVVGAYGVSFVVAMFNGLLADVMTRPLVRPVRRGGEREGAWGGPLRGPLFAVSLVLVMVLTYGGMRVTQTDAIERGGQSVRLTVVQTDVPQDNKTQGTDLQDLENFWEMIQLSEQAMRHDPPPDLIVWPETMVPRAINDEAIDIWREYQQVPEDLADRLVLDAESFGFWHGLGRMPYEGYRRTIEAFADEHDVVLVVGAHAMEQWREPEAAEGGPAGPMPRLRYNAAYLFEPGAGLVGRYDKLHRVPFGEYMPWVEYWPALQRLVLRLTPYDHDYSLQPGEAFTVFDLETEDRAWRLATPICFEDVVSYVPRKMVWQHDRKATDLLLNLTNDGWFAGTAEAPQHEQIARFRSVENRVPMARAVNRGVSGFIDSAGRIRSRVSVNGETQEVAGVATADVHRDERTTIFMRVGDLFAGLCLALTAGLGIIAGFGNFRGWLMRKRESDEHRQDQADANAGKQAAGAKFRATSAWLLAATIGLLGGGAAAVADDAAAEGALPPDQLEAPDDVRRVAPLDAGRDAIIGPRALDEETSRQRNEQALQQQRQLQQEQERLRQEQVEAAQQGEADDIRPLPRESAEAVAAMNDQELEAYALKLLVEASMSDWAMLRANAVEALQERPERALPVTHRLLDDENPGVRYAAVVTAGMLDFRDLAPAVRPLLEDDHPAVRAAAMATLHQLGERINLTPLADMLRSEDPSLRGNVALLLGLMGDRSAVPMLKLAAVEPMARSSAGEAAVARIQIAEAIARLGDDSGLESLRAGAYSQFDEVRVVAVIAMGAAGDRRMEHGVEQMLQEPPMEVQLAAAGTLAQLGNDGGRAIAIELAEHENAVIRAQAAWVMGWFDDPATLENLRNLLADGSEQVRVSAAAALLRRHEAPAETAAERTRG